MLRKMLITVVTITVCIFAVSSCKKSSDQTGAEEVKTAAEYKTEAEKEITEENMAQELEKLEKAISEDASQQ